MYVSKLIATMFKDKTEFAYFLLVLILTVCLTWLLSPKDHQVEINKRFNEIEERTKQLEHDITTLSQPVDLSTYTDQLLSIKESIANNIERLSFLETQSHRDKFKLKRKSTLIEECSESVDILMHNSCSYLYTYTTCSYKLWSAVKLNFTWCPLGIYAKAV